MRRATRGGGGDERGLACATPGQWKRRVIKEGSKGLIVADFWAMRVVAGCDGLPGPEVWLVLRRLYPGPFLFGPSAAVVKKNVTGLTVPQVHLLLMAVLPKRACDTAWVLEILHYRQERNYAAYLSHRKQRQLRLQ